MAPSELVVPFAVGLVFLGCCSNVVFLELIVREDPGAGNIITFFQFLTVSVEGLLFVSKQPQIPIKEYMKLVGFYFTVSVINNYSLNFNIPMPLHMIFRAGSLMANLILGIILLKKEYPISKYVAVLMITVGISSATVASARQMNASHNSSSAVLEEHSLGGAAVTDILIMVVGISLLLFALFTSARMGIFQEVLYKKYGKHAREAMFYTHALPLPGFLLLATDIWKRTLTFTASEPVAVGFLSVPKLWLFLVGNCFTQYICIRGVFILTTECPSLMVTLVVTLRKFISLLFSIFYFRNPFTVLHWASTLLVFAGTALFTGILNPLLPRPKTLTQKAKEE